MILQEIEFIFSMVGKLWGAETGVKGAGRDSLSEAAFTPVYNSWEITSCESKTPCEVLPDRLTVAEWDAAQIGSAEATADSTAVYEELLIPLMKGKVYEITAEWAGDQLESRKFSGTASDTVITEWRKKPGEEKKERLLS